MTSNLAAEEIAEHGLQLRADDLDATEGRMKGEDFILFKTNCSVFCMKTVMCFVARVISFVKYHHLKTVQR